MNKSRIFMQASLFIILFRAYHVSFAILFQLYMLAYPDHSIIYMQVVDWISKQAGKFADNFSNYKFYVKYTPETIDSSTKLFLSTFTNRDEQAIVPCLYKWSRLKNGIISEAVQFKGNTFICEPSDVGSIIQAQVTSTDQQNPGTAVLKFGPVQIDVLLKQTIEGALSTGQIKFQVDVFHEDRTKQCTLTITDDYIKIAHCNSSANFRFNYCLGQPLINGLIKDPVNIAIVFPQKYQTQTIKFLLELWNDICLSKQQKMSQELIMNLKFVNRRSKDEFLFVMKGFIAKKQLKYSAVITKIEKLEVDHSNINYMMQIESLRKDLLKLFNQNKRVQEQKKVYFQETIRLEQQIQQIISSYTKIIQGKFKTKEEFQQSFVDFQNKKDHAIAHKYKKIQEENNRLKQYIRQKVDGNIEIAVFNPLEARQDNLNPFGKKKEPFAQIQLKTSQNQYENILQNLQGQEELLVDQNKHYSQVIAQKSKLEQKLNRSLMKIQKLEGELQKLNRSGLMENNQGNLSMSRNNTSALDISTSKVVQEKTLIEKKYAKLKEDYNKLKTTYQTLKDTVAVSDNSNPQVKEIRLEIQRLKNSLIALEKQKDSWKQKAELVGIELRKQKEEHQRTKSKLQRKVFELNQQLSMLRKNSDVLNRSQHLSMQMDQYNQQQTEILKEQNTFLMSENERLTKMCEKYKTEYKKIKEGLKTNSIIL